MADKIKRVLLLFWHMIWPLLLYEATGTLVQMRAYFVVSGKGTRAAGSSSYGGDSCCSLCVSGKTISGTVLQYSEQRKEKEEGLFLAVCLVGGSWSRELPFI